MILFPNAKLNLGLSVVRKRNDGYHDLETVFYPLPVHDAIEIIPSTNVTTNFSAFGLPVEGNSTDNLVVKAFHLLANEFSLPAVEIMLHKTIPMGAGLGGGSADAAFTIRLLNELFHLRLNDLEMAKRAALLGADCPFFVYNQPLYAEGTGDRLTPINLSLKGLYFLLIKPDLHISTREAFSGISPHEATYAVKETIQRPIEEWRGRLHNDFEDSIFAIHPLLAEVKQTLYNMGALYAAMSGSGSTLFGIFRENPEQLNPASIFPNIETRIVGQFD